MIKKQQKKITEMPFLEHVGELRKHLIRILIGIGIGCIVVGIFWDTATNNFIMAPLHSDFFTYQAFNQLAEATGFDPFYDDFKLTKGVFNRNPSGQLTTQILVLIILGMIISIPYLMFEVWGFIKPALTPKEQQHTTGFVVATTLFFLMGVAFAFYILLPLSIHFLFFYNPFGIENEWTISSYIQLFVQTLLGMGIVFLFPVLVYFLTKIGLLSPMFLKTYRKHAFLVVLVVAAIITPSDIFSMFVAAMPLWLLYEFSIILSKMVYKKQPTALAKK